MKYIDRMAAKEKCFAGRLADGTVIMTFHELSGLDEFLIFQTGLTVEKLGAIIR